MRFLLPAVLVATVSTLPPSHAQPAPKPPPQVPAAPLAAPSPAPQAGVQEPGPDAAPPGDRHWLTDSRSGCRLWELYPMPGETVSWSGPCVNGVAEGEGAAVKRYGGATNFSTFRGMMRRGLPNGHGVLILSDGSSYDGGFKDDRLDGRGVYILADGSRYEGELRGNQPEGDGVLTDSRGGVARGVWHEGCLRDGNGVSRFRRSQAECERLLPSAEAAPAPPGPSPAASPPKKQLAPSPAPAEDPRATGPKSNAWEIGLLAGEQEVCGATSAAVEVFATRYALLFELNKAPNAKQDMEAGEEVGKDWIRSGRQTCDGLRSSLAALPQRLASMMPDELRGGLVIISKLRGKGIACGIPAARLDALWQRVMTYAVPQRTPELDATLEKERQGSATLIRTGRADCKGVPEALDTLDKAFP